MVGSFSTRVGVWHGIAERRQTSVDGDHELYLRAPCGHRGMVGALGVAVVRNDGRVTCRTCAFVMERDERAHAQDLQFRHPSKTS